MTLAFTAGVLHRFGLPMSAVERCLIPWPPSATAFSFIRGGASGRTDGVSHGLVELKKRTSALNIKGKRMIQISVLRKTNARFLFAFSRSARQKITTLQTRQQQRPLSYCTRRSNHTLPDFTEKICAIHSPFPPTSVLNLDSKQS